ncbi:hypothetical protein CHUAL_004060 [Chamberlinius hualienensis]
MCFEKTPNVSSSNFCCKILVLVGGAKTKNNNNCKNQPIADGPPHTLVPLPTSATHVPADVYALTSPYTKFDPCRAYRLHQEEPKPQHSYIGLIGMAILSSPDKKLVLSDIYQYILDNYSYFRNRGPGWRNSIRHNLSLNDCFVKAGRSANGKGHFWAIHPANLEDFKKGDFRRRKAQRRVRKHLGLSVPEDEDSLSPPPPPPSSQQQQQQSPTVTIASPTHTTALLDNEQHQQPFQQNWSEKPDSTTSGNYIKSPPSTPVTKKRRQFDMDSILAPERRHCCDCNDEHSTANIVCCNDFHFNSRGLFGAIFKNGGVNITHNKHSPTSAWTESKMHKQELEQSPSACEDGKSQQLMIDECSSSSLVTETNPNWSIPTVEDEIGSDSRPNSHESSCSNASSSVYSVKATSNEKGLTLIKGPNEVNVTMEQFQQRQQTKFLPVSSSVSSTNMVKRINSNESLLTISTGPLALISTPTGRPITHSSAISTNLDPE